MKSDIAPYKQPAVYTGTDTPHDALTGIIGILQGIVVLRRHGAHVMGG